MNGAFTPEPEHLEPNNSRETGFLQRAKENNPVQICQEALRKRKWELFAVILRLVGTILKKNATGTKILPRIQSLTSLLNVLSNVTRLTKQLTLICNEI